MANFLRMLLGVALLPACFGMAAALCRALAGAGGLRVEAFALLGGIAVFVLCWTFLSHPVKTYVFGHEMTHALWGVLFGARPTKLRVGERGGSVTLTKSNMLITLAPYFFPFYTFVVILAAVVTGLFVRPLPVLPVWVFLVGFTWAFHVLFTLQTLTERQPDVALYGRIFSWTFIFIANAALVMAWLAATTELGFGAACATVASCVAGAYVWTWDRCADVAALFGSRGAE